MTQPTERGEWPIERVSNILNVGMTEARAAPEPRHGHARLAPPLQPAICRATSPHPTACMPCALLHGHRALQDVLLWLLRHGVSIDSLNGRGISPLQFFAEKGNLGQCELLLKHGADVDFQYEHDPLGQRPAIDNEGETALHFAVNSRGAAVVSLLLEASRTALAPSSRRPLERARQTAPCSTANAYLQVQEQRSV